MALEAAEDHRAIDGRSGVLLGVHGGYGGTLPLKPPRRLSRAYGFCATSADPGLRGQHCMYRMGNNVIGGRERAKYIDIRKHLAHEVIQNGHMKLIRFSTTSQP